MKVGDLVMVRQDIDEYVKFHGKTLGVITFSSKTSPQLIEVAWHSRDPDFEFFYSDELEVVSESR
jgi:hypothetical protein